MFCGRTGELDTDVLGGLELPGHAGHDIHGIGTADTDGAEAQPTAVGRVRVRADDETAGEGCQVPQG